MKSHLVILFFFIGATAWAQGRYHAGDVVPRPYLKVFGHEQFFCVSPLTYAQKEMMAGSSFKSLKGLSWDDLRYLQVLHCDADGNAIVGEMVCNSIIANDLLEIFKTLYQAAYPIERMRLVEHYASDDEASMRNNNTSCFNQRASAAGGKVSEHSFGLAVDINPRYNPYFKVKASGKVIVRPEGSEEYLNREANSPYIIKKGDLCYRLFKQHGFQWGGDWASGKDYQHFERSQTSKRYE